MKLMERNWLIFVFVLLMFSSCTITGNVTSIPEEDINISVFFCPEDMCLERLLGLIDDSDDIKCAFYDLDLPILIERLVEKGAQVLIEDSNSLDCFMTGYSSALMHNKFCVFDEEIVFTGSMNPTERGNYYNNNNILIIDSPSIAQNYLDEFDELSAGRYGEGNSVRFPVVYSDELSIENYFCPEDNCKSRVINALSSAEESIYFMTFSFTDQDIGNLLYNKDYLGLDVRGIFEEKQASKYSVIEDIRIHKIDNNPYTMHHKVFIVDNETVITGSYNPTKNADERNDENILIIHDEYVADRYLREFEKLWYEINVLSFNQTEGVVISEVMYDPKGSDKGNEYVMIKNLGNNDEVLDYYFLSNNKTNSRLEGTIGAGEEVKIFPKFLLKNSDGMLFVKKNLHVIDSVFWEGIWEIASPEEESLKRIRYDVSGMMAWVQE